MLGLEFGLAVLDSLSQEMNTENSKMYSVIFIAQWMVLKQIMPTSVEVSIINNSNNF